jgi:putative hydrolase of the HAD superfamily
VISIKAIICDLDGTLYRHPPVRRGMAFRLAAHALRSPGSGWRTLRFVSAYRRAQEVLRQRGRPFAEDAQLLLACEETAADPEWGRRLVDQWIEVAPLDLVRRHVRRDAIGFLDMARRHGVRLAVFSDYPAAAKLDAMGLRSHFDVVRWAQEPDVSAFKPDPRGLRLTLAALNVDASDALYVGDRPDIDAAAALAAGMRAAVIGAHPSLSTPSCLHVRSFTELTATLGWLPQ